MTHLCFATSLHQQAAHPYSWQENTQPGERALLWTNVLPHKLHRWALTTLEGLALALWPLVFDDRALHMRTCLALRMNDAWRDELSHTFRPHQSAVVDAVAFSWGRSKGDKLL
jgi:hypothetical protein